MTSQNRELVGIIGHALEHQRGGAVRKRPVDDVAVPGHPADIGGAPVDVAVMIVEHVLVGHCRRTPDTRPWCEHALGFAGRARRVKNEQRVFGVHRLGRAIGRHGLRDLVIVDVAARFHVHGGAGASHHDHGIDPAGALRGGIGIGLERHLAPAAHAFIGGDHDRRDSHPRCGRRASRGKSRRTPPNGWRRCVRRRASHRRLRESSAGKW